MPNYNKLLTVNRNGQIATSNVSAKLIHASHPANQISHMNTEAVQNLQPTAKVILSSKLYSTYNIWVPFA